MNTALILFVLSGTACLIGLVAIWRKKTAVFVGCIIIAVFGVIHGFRISFLDNQQMEETIQRAGPALIDSLLKGEAVPMEDDELPKLISELAKRLNYPSDVIKALGNRTNYYINFMVFPLDTNFFQLETNLFRLETNNVPAVTNQPPQTPKKHPQQQETFGSAMLCQANFP